MDHAPKPKLHLEFFYKKCIHIFYLQKHCLTTSKSHLLLPISNWISQSNVVWSFKCHTKRGFFCKFNSNLDIFKILLNKPITLSSCPHCTYQGEGTIIGIWARIYSFTPPSKWIPSISLLFATCLIKIFKTSSTIRKKYGASKHPCLTPLLIGNVKIIVPLKWIANLAS